MARFDVSEAIKEIEDKNIVLVTVPSEAVEEVNTELLSHINSEEGTTVYMTVAKPYSTITNILEEKDIDTSQMFFIDCITKTNGEPSEAENCVFLRPQALTDISIALSQAVESMPDGGEKYLVMDTLSTLMLYNERDTVGKFAHSIANKIREWGIKSVMLTLEEEADEELTSQIRQFCDSCIDINPE